MRLEVKDFSFFNKEVLEEVAKLKKLLDDGHYVTLEMSKSTSLNEDLCLINIHFATAGDSNSKENYYYALSVNKRNKYYPMLLEVNLFKKSKEELK